MFVQIFSQQSLDQGLFLFLLLSLLSFLLSPYCAASIALGETDLSKHYESDQLLQNATSDQHLLNLLHLYPSIKFLNISTGSKTDV